MSKVGIGNALNSIGGFSSSFMSVVMIVGAVLFVACAVYVVVEDLRNDAQDRRRLQVDIDSWKFVGFLLLLALVFWLWGTFEGKAAKSRKPWARRYRQVSGAMMFF